MSAPLIVIGVDGLPPSLFERLIGDERMPVLAGLVERGCAGVLRSTPNYQSASAWTSMVTGVNPGRHGILHFTNPVRGSYQFAQIDARARRAPSIWRILSEAEVRVAALNLPVSYPAEQVPGVMVAGWLCPSPESTGFTHPPELARWITDTVGDYPIHPDVRRYAAAGRFGEVARIARRGIRVKLDLARRIMQRERPDLLWCVVTETDSLQHWCWHLLDESASDHDPLEAARWREALLGVYEALDSALGEVLAEAGDEADILIVSDHGQAPNSGGQVLLRPWLVHEGYIVPRARSAPHRAADRALAAGFEWLRRHAGRRLKSWLRARFPALQSRAQQGAKGLEIDWPRTRAGRRPDTSSSTPRGCGRKAECRRAPNAMLCCPNLSAACWSCAMPIPVSESLPM